MRLFFYRVIWCGRIRIKSCPEFLAANQFMQGCMNAMQAILDRVQFVKNSLIVHFQNLPSVVGSNMHRRGWLYRGCLRDMALVGGAAFSLPSRPLPFDVLTITTIF